MGVEGRLGAIRRRASDTAGESSLVGRGPERRMAQEVLAGMTDKLACAANSSDADCSGFAVAGAVCQ